ASPGPRYRWGRLEKAVAKPRNRDRARLGRRYAKLPGGIVRAVPTGECDSTPKIDLRAGKPDVVERSDILNIRDQHLHVQDNGIDLAWVEHAGQPVRRL